MSITWVQIIFYISLIIWLFPPIRQFRNRLFFFFLVLAIADPIGLLYQAVLNRPAPQLYTLFLSICMVISLFEIETIKKHRYILISIILAILALLFFITLPMKVYMPILLVVQIVILIMLLKLSILKYVSSGKLNLFYSVLIFYQLTVVIKFFNFMIGFADAGALFIFTTIAQNIFGLFFSIVRENKQEAVTQH